MDVKGMYRKAIAVFFIVLMAISLMPLTEADVDIIDLGTISYKSTKTIGINASHDVDIVNVYSPLINSISYRKVGFNRLINITTYNFESKMIAMDYTFKNDSKPYLFQDITSKQLYRIYIDYSGVSIPISPLAVLYKDVFSKYNHTSVNYTKANNSLTNMTEKFNRTYELLLKSSLNESLAQNRANSLARDKRNLADSMFRTQIVAVLLIFFCSLLAVFLARKFGWLAGNPNRKLKRMETGYGPFAKTMDRFIKKKNDDITMDKKEKVLEIKLGNIKQQMQPRQEIEEIQQQEPLDQLPTIEQSLARSPVKRYPVSPAIEQEFNKMMSDNDTIKRTLVELNKKLDKKKE